MADSTAASAASTPMPGQLVLACFHVMWMKDCVRAMATAKELATAYPACKFCSIAADTLELQHISRKYEVRTFPTFILFRSGKEIGRFEGHVGFADALVNLLTDNITDADKEAYELRKKQKEDEEAQQKGAEAAEKAAEEESAEIEWVWDIDGTGRSMHIEELGMQISLRDEDDEEEVVWEYCFDPNGWGVGDDDPGWTSFTDDLQPLIEEQYRSGTLYKDDHNIDIEPSALTDVMRGVTIWESSISIKANSLTGLRGEFVDIEEEDKAEDDDDDDDDDEEDSEMVVRRRGPRLVVPGEPQVSEQQKKIDESMAKWRAAEKRRKKMMALYRRGKDCEAARGTAGLTANSGVHKWELKWQHEPARGGKADGVGLVSESFENYGPCQEPCLGGDDEMASIALYANGEIYQGKKCIATTSYRRTLPEGMQAAAPASADALNTFKVDDRVVWRMEGYEPMAGKVRAVSPNNTYEVVFDYENMEFSVRGEDLMKLEKETSAPAPCWGRNSKITIIFDTDSKAGSGILTFAVDDHVLEDVVIENVFKKLGGGAAYPAICMCPFARNINIGEDDSEKRKLPEGEAKKEEDKEADKQEEDGKEKAEGEESSEDEEESAEEEDTPEKLRAAHIEKARKLGITEDLAAKSDSELLTLIKKRLQETQPPKFPAVLLLGEKPVAQAEKPRKAKKKKKKSKDGGEEAAEEDDAAADEEIPIDRCVWMFETENGWEQYPKDISSQLETARRNNKQEIQVRVGGRPLTVRLTGSKDGSSSNEPEQKSDTGETAKVRRHVVSEGLRGQWELLSLKFSASTRSLRGGTALEMLRKVWNGEERMDGRELGLGFLFLYTLLQGQVRVKIVSSWSDYGYGGYEGYGGGMYGGYGGGSGYGGYGGGGGYGGYGGGYASSYYYGASEKKGGGSSAASSSDSHRFAMLLAQLYADRRTKSVCNSVINVLARNKQLCTRMPKLKDTRKTKKTPVFNGWVDEREPRSPLSDLFNHVVPLLQNLRTKRGTIQFPPKPPYPELPLPPNTCAPVAIPKGLAKGERAWLRPELSDFSNDQRSLTAITASEIAKLAMNSLHRVVKPCPEPVDIEEEDEFYEFLAEAKDMPVIAIFHAKWCSSCVTFLPVFRTIAKRTPTVRFMRIDVDDCDKLAAKFEVQKLPHTIFLKGKPQAKSPQDCRATIVGGGPKWVEETDKMIENLLTDEEKVELAKYRSEVSGTVPPELEEAMQSAKKMETLDDEIACLAEWPSRAVAESTIENRTRAELGKSSVSDHLSFDISRHDAAVTAVAESMLQRMKEDVVEYAKATNSAKIPSLKCLREETLNAFFDGGDAEAFKAGRQGVKVLLANLNEARALDAKMVSEALPLLLKASNHVDITSSSLTSEEKQKRLDFLLRRQSGQEPQVWLEFLYGALLSSKCKDDILMLNPYLDEATITLLERLTTCTILRANRVGHTNRCIASAIRLDELLAKVEQLSSDKRSGEKQTLLPRVNQAVETLAGLLSTGRFYISRDSKRVFDPRFMVFEFVWNLCLRRKQIEIVEMFRENLGKDISKVKQMIMGAGKTTVVAPLLALMLADGKSLVVSVVPKALLEMSRTLMRETFASIMNKRIYTLRFDRSTKVQPVMRRTLENAAKNRGIVVATPTTIKSIMLSYLESLEHLDLARAGKYSYEPIEVVAKRCAELASMLKLFKTGVMLLDEVDLILHPLKSELNFPKGEKFDLDVSEQGERWGLPIHLFDAIFFAQSGRVTSFEARGAALDILRRLESAVREGYSTRSLQKLPHITLLNPTFYARKLKPILAEWAYLWLQKQHLHGIDRDEAVKYVLSGAAARSEGKAKESLLEKALEDSSLPGESKQHLDSALGNARKTRELTDALYEAEEQLESYLAASAESLASIDAEIASITKAIKEAEYPRDDSLDNNVIVWYSQAFAPSHSAHASPSKLASLRALGTMCSELESNGYTVKRCDQADEAAARVRELQANGHLRCVIAAGGEGVVGCSGECEDSHSGNCLVCGQGWGSHSGHTCPDGRRGSWPENEDDDQQQEELMGEYEDFISGLLYSVGQTSLPESRVSIFGGHSTLPETLRLSYWRLGVYVADDEQKLQAWCDLMQDWPGKTEESDGEE